MNERSTYTRRALLGTAAAAAAGVAASVPGMAAAGSGEDDQMVASDTLKLVDEQGRQRFLASSTKPPVIIDGQVIPASQRQGDEHATWLIFNEDQGSERGGIVAAATAAQLSLDFANAQAITLGTEWQGKSGLAAVTFNQMPDPALPIEQVTSVPQRAALGWTSGFGAFLSLNDSNGRTRILLQVDEQDVPRIQILDGQGKVVVQFPPG
jgi:hypothetical protein